MMIAALLAFGALHAAADRAVLARGGFVAAANLPRTQPWQLRARAPLAREMTASELVEAAPRPATLARRSGSSAAAVAAAFAGWAVAHHGLWHDAGVAVISAVGAVLWLGVWTTLAKRGAIQPTVSRKIVHCGSGPLFLAMWPFFSSRPAARLVAAGVPLLQIVRLVSAGQSPSLSARAPLRCPGGPSRALHALLSHRTVVFGRNRRARRRCLAIGARVRGARRPAVLLRRDPRGRAVRMDQVVGRARRRVSDGRRRRVRRHHRPTVSARAASAMARAESLHPPPRLGAAAPTTTRYGSAKWPWSKQKSYAGSAAFAVGAFAVTLSLMAWFEWLGCISISAMNSAGAIAFISFACALVELVSARADARAPRAAALFLMWTFHAPRPTRRSAQIPLGDDNITVPIAASVLAHIMLQ